MSRQHRAAHGPPQGNEPAIVIGDLDLSRLRDVIDVHSSGRDQANAERLEAELDRAIVVPQAQVKPGTVTMEARVTFEETQTGQRREITLCYPREADPARGRVSILAPVASALLGLGVGDSIEWPMPGGRRATFRVAAVHQAAEEAAVQAT